MRAWAVIAAGVMLAGPGLAAPPPVLPNPFNDRVARLSPANRLGALRRAVTSDGGRCGRLEAAVYRGPWGNLRLWQVRCRPGGEYGVFLGPAGEVQVRSCAELATLDLLKCAAPR